ncbi:MAG: acyl-CoA dehydrogenase family protein [Deltaproteobacteria bacterium]|nr:acyl-CoA dehydrogenase family protein [Deltaproteobacteria bacterium]
MTIDTLLSRLLDKTLAPPAVDTLRAWWEATAAERESWPHTVDRALVGGACADRVGFAFASGYFEALRALAPNALSGITALCATEEGGNHPGAIQTRLEPAGPGRYTLSGKKKWATVASEASALLVVATAGESAEGRNQLRVVRVATTAPGVRLQSTTAPFVPEIPHAEVELDGVEVGEADILPGDGYDDYLKPFRTVEDIHVHASVIGYLIGVSRRHDFPHEIVQSLTTLAVVTRSLADADVKAPATHIALAGLIDLATRAVASVEEKWGAVPDDEWKRWLRDRALLQVSGKARAARRERAWEAFG